MSGKEPKSSVFRVTGGDFLIEDAIVENSESAIVAKDASVTARRSLLRRNGVDIYAERSRISAEDVGFIPPDVERETPPERRPIRRNRAFVGGWPEMPWKKRQRGDERGGGG